MEKLGELVEHLEIAKGKLAVQEDRTFKNLKQD